MSRWGPRGRRLNDGEPLPGPKPGDRRTWDFAHENLHDEMDRLSAQNWCRLINAKSYTTTLPDGARFRRVRVTLEYAP